MQIKVTKSARYVLTNETDVRRKAEKVYKSRINSPPPMFVKGDYCCDKKLYMRVCANDGALYRVEIEKSIYYGDGSF